MNIWFSLFTHALLLRSELLGVCLASTEGCMEAEVYNSLREDKRTNECFGYLIGEEVSYETNKPDLYI